MKTSRSVHGLTGAGIAFALATGMIVPAPVRGDEFVLVNFDTPKMVTWRRRVRDPDTGDYVVREFMKTTTPSGLTFAQKTEIMSRMAARWVGVGVRFTEDENVPHSKTLDFTGSRTPPEIGRPLFGTTALDDSAAWVFVGELTGRQTHGENPRPLTDQEEAIAIAHTADHEVGHLFGLGHRWDGSLMTEGMKVDWETRRSLFLLLSDADRTQVRELRDRDDHAAHLHPGTRHGLVGLFDLGSLPEDEPITEDLFFGANVFYEAEADVEGFDYGVLDSERRFLIRGSLERTALGDESDVFTAASGEGFNLALRGPDGIVYSELNNSLLDLELAAPDGEVFQTATFFFDVRPDDGNESPNVFITLSTADLNPGSGFVRELAPGLVPAVSSGGLLGLLALISLAGCALLHVRARRRGSSG